MNFAVVDKDGRASRRVAPGVENFPKESCHRPYAGPTFKVEFDKEIPEIDPGPQAVVRADPVRR